MLSDFIRTNSFAIVAGYKQGEIIAALGSIAYRDRLIEIFFPKMNPFETDQKITFHLDNRTGVEEFDSNLKVYRVSVKARVAAKKGRTLLVEPVEFEMKYSNKIIDRLVLPGYAFPADNRKEIRLEEAVLTAGIIPNDTEKENKLGVLITKAVERPHTTVMAFLSSIHDDIFIISHTDSFKSKNINRDDHCVFAIDHRSNYIFEKAIDWNYTLIKGRLRTVSRSNPAFGAIQQQFIEKNPWEYAFFTDPKIEMYYIQPLEIMCPEKLT